MPPAPTPPAAGPRPSPTGRRASRDHEGMTFEGFGEGAVEFYDGLLADNSKAYWTDQRAVYESDVREPMLALLAALEPEFGGPGKVFRPYRDVRFSADKTPYKTHCGGYTPPYYVQLSADGLMVAAGYYRMESALGAKKTDTGTCSTRATASRSSTSNA
ncbi:hypothetical protein PSD17_54990 [Pseudonocardia sp. D17]|nr:hypothetical protein PSD17_54990 [Pseudonocardia sp. D17]